jgi:hypothetical protein
MVVACLSDCLQLLTLHAFIDGRACVVGFAWMKSKSEVTYQRVFKEFFYLQEYKYLEAFVSGILYFEVLSKLIFMFRF